MPRDFRKGRFSSSRRIGEDVNPNAYVVNLVDCMLVLAVAFLVALIGYWNVDLNVTDLSGKDLQQVDPQTLESQASGNGSYYVEAGKVYQDPQTGQLYMVETKDGAVSSASGASSASSASASSSASGSTGASSGTSKAAAGSSSASQGASSSSSSAAASDDDIRAQRAAGGD